MTRENKGDKMDQDQENILKKRIQTTMIGALHEFEKSFGYLWGQDKSEDEELTEKEDKFLDIWEDTRNKILNNGNNQLRKAVSEINKIQGNLKYNYKFYRKGNTNE
jgi:hypothetical protein